MQSMSESEPRVDDVIFVYVHKAGWQEREKWGGVCVCVCVCLFCGEEVQGGTAANSSRDLEYRGREGEIKK